MQPPLAAMKPAIAHSGEPTTVLAPLVFRHAEDAAFYWSVHDGSTQAPHLRLADLARFGRLLAAHLEGLRVADLDGLSVTRAALERWRKPGEAFVHAWLTQQISEGPQAVAQSEQELFSIVRSAPEALLRGVIAALGWLPRGAALQAIWRWSGAAEPLAQVAALRGAALIGVDALTVLHHPIGNYLRSANVHVRAAACRAAACGTGADLLAGLRAALEDTEVAVRAEAAIALGRHGHALEGEPWPITILWQCLVAGAALSAYARGWHRGQLLRRLQRWVRHLAALAPPGSFDPRRPFLHMPPRVALTFVAYHCDTQYLPYVIEHMQDLQHARYAGWVWQTLTGVDLVAAQLTLPEPESTRRQLDQPLTEARLDADRGLPLPHVQAVRAWEGRQLPHGLRWLLGAPLTAENALSILDTAPQGLRSIAATALLYVAPAWPVSVRGPFAAQQIACDSLRQQLAA